MNTHNLSKYWGLGYWEQKTFIRNCDDVTILQKIKYKEKNDGNACKETLASKVIKRLAKKGKK